MNNKQTISFHRQYNAYTGGHQKVRDYIGHTLSSDNFAPQLWLENNSEIRTNLFSHIDGLTYQQRYAPDKTDWVFLAGMDWQAYAPFFDHEQPKLNLVQHIRHSDKNHPLFQFLQHKAIRLCVSDAVKNAIEPFANGPCLTIKMGHVIPKITVPKSYDLYILATKQPKLGMELKQWADSKGLSVLIHDKPVEQEAVHIGMAASRVGIVLPNKTEGFYLPGIEAMALCDWAVVPDCVASREYSLKKANVTQCELGLTHCQTAIEHAFMMCNKWTLPVKKWHGRKISLGYRLDRERQTFKKVLNTALSLW
jgi:hypothetical protein